MFQSNDSQETRAGNTHLPWTMIHCSGPENIHTPSTPPPQQGLEFPGDRGFFRTQKLKEMFEAYLEYLERWERSGYFMELHICIFFVNVGLGNVQSSMPMSSINLISKISVVAYNVCKSVVLICILTSMLKCSLLVGFSCVVFFHAVFRCRQ